MFLKIVIIFIFIFTLINLRNFLKLIRKQKVIRSKTITAFNKKNLNNWMNLTKKERYTLSKQDSVDYMARRKLLLDEIRKEYKKISKENFEGKIKKK
tara:strand:- start:119 stop:409 length:291 start_codon:yes stop_codon:yes gene_type:complete